MPRDMFGDVVDPSIKVGSQKWYTVPLSILAHVALFAAVIIIPLMATDVLPTPPSMMAFVGAPPPPPPPPPRHLPLLRTPEDADADRESERGAHRSAEGKSCLRRHRLVCRKAYPAVSKAASRAV